jgi:hypothetical protein
MKRRLLGLCLLLSLAIALPSMLEAQAPKPATKAPTDSDKLQAGEFSGSLKSTPGSDRTFILKIDQRTLQPTGRGVNPGRVNRDVQRILNAQNQILQAQNRVATARTPQQRNSAMQHLQRAQVSLQQATVALNVAAAGGVGVGGAPPGYRWVVTSSEIEFQAMEEAKIRTLVLPENYDEKGNIKKYTKQELDELKGKDKNLPGYESEMEKLETGMKVKVVLAPRKKSKPADKPAAAEKADDKDKDAEKGKNKDLDDDGEKKMQVKMIIITENAPAAANARGKKR